MLIENQITKTISIPSQDRIKQKPKVKTNHISLAILSNDTQVELKWLGIFWKKTRTWKIFFRNQGYQHIFN